MSDNELTIGDSTIIGPGAMIHGRRIGADRVVEPGAIVCDANVIGAGSVVRAGAVVKQRSQFAAVAEIDGFPAVEVAYGSTPSPVPAWVLRPDELPRSL